MCEIIYACEISLWNDSSLSNHPMPISGLCDISASFSNQNNRVSLHSPICKKPSWKASKRVVHWQQHMLWAHVSTTHRHQHISNAHSPSGELHLVFFTQVRTVAPLLQPKWFRACMSPLIVLALARQNEQHPLFRYFSNASSISVKYGRGPTSAWRF